MLSDPRIGRTVALAVSAAGLLWLLGQWVAADALFARMGYAMHAATLLAIFALLAGAASAWLFDRFARVRADLLAGRGVIAAWRVDPETFARFAPVALADDRRDKRQALVAVWILLAVVFGAFALYDPEVALPMMGIALAVAVVIGLAYLAGGRIAQSHWRLRSGDVVVGPDGLLFNDVLHVWALPASRLVAVTRLQRPPTLLVTYRYWTRLGPQAVTVTLPVPPDAADAARTAEAGLAARLRGGRRSG